MVRIRYYIHVVINQNYNKLTLEEEFIVHNIDPEP